MMILRKIFTLPLFLLVQIYDEGGPEVRFRELTPKRPRIFFRVSVLRHILEVLFILRLDFDSFKSE